MKKHNTPIKLPHYFICMECATEKGGVIPPDSCNTVHEDQCPYCGKTATLVPIVDFNWPDKTKDYFKKLRD